MKRLGDWFKPKWKHSDWKVRKQAVQTLNDETVLTEIAKTDPHEDVAAAALKRLGSPENLIDVLVHASKPGIRGMAIKWLKDDEATVARAACQDPDPRVRVEAIYYLHDKELLKTIARKDPHPEVRKMAMFHIEDQVFLKEMVESDPHAKIRAAAVLGIEDPALLQQIAEKDSDKDVRLLAWNHLESLKSVTEDAQQGQNHTDS